MNQSDVKQLAQTRENVQMCPSGEFFSMPIIDIIRAGGLLQLQAIRKGIKLDSLNNKQWYLPEINPSN